MPLFDLICLANSRKHQGRCIAGLKTDGTGWVRPIGADNDGSLKPRHYYLSNDTEAQVLDLIRVELTRVHPKPHQPENWSVGRKRWELLARPAPRSCLAVLRPYIVPGPSIFDDLYDRVAYNSCEQTPARASLALVIPEHLRWRVQITCSGRRQTRAVFRLRGYDYDLALTDPVWEQRLRGLSPGYHAFEAAGVRPDSTILLTISLGEPFQGYCYKLVAAVIVL